jgi:translation initiation factor IF-3
MYTRSYSTKRQNRDKGPKRNEMIIASSVLLIDEKNENLGEVKTPEALAKAKAVSLDLVEVSSENTPPVCRIMDYSKYRFEQKKKLKDGRKRSRPKEMKEYKFTAVIEQNDINFRVKRAIQYLDKGHNVRITMFRKGRQSREIAQEKMEEILTYFDGYSTIEPEISREGRRSFITYKANAKTKNKQNSTKENKEDKS